MNLLEILKFSARYLEERNIPKARLAGEKIIARVLCCDKIYLYANFDRELSSTEKEQIKACLRKVAENGGDVDGILAAESAGKVDWLAENRELLRKSAEYLEKYGVPNAGTDAEHLFAHALKVRRSLLTARLRGEIADPEKDLIRELLVRRGKYRKPLQYIIGEWEFYGYPFLMAEGVLIPRPDTEVVAEQAKHLLSGMEKPKVLDLGCGCGAIGIALAMELPEADVTGVDINPAALSLSEKNKLKNNTNNIKFIKSDLFSALKGERYQLIVSNPPYISQKEYEELMPEVLRYEAKSALTDGADGLRFYEAIAREAGDYLTEGGWLVFEIGRAQAAAVGDILEKHRFDVALTGKDYGGNDRVVVGKCRQS
ncbi:MAG: peptide chain release factor N(5)-glutamine methyltransferase [Fusobacteriaceae bacterium]|jgi:release factor glutamine methyltransferase|nr:peptide chain release factor N(5)-glutamine methyltransferase [Fusobacteriaceae bacterium]